MPKSGKTLWQKEKLLILSNFYICHYVFKKLSAAEASESVYMRERVMSTLVESGPGLVCKLVFVDYMKTKCSS